MRCCWSFSCCTNIFSLFCFYLTFSEISVCIIFFIYNLYHLDLFHTPRVIVYIYIYIYINVWSWLFSLVLLRVSPYHWPEWTILSHADYAIYTYIYIYVCVCVCPHVSRILISILADLNNDVVWKVSARSLISNSSRPFVQHLEIVPSTPITLDITVTFMFHSFFGSQARSTYYLVFRLFLFLFSFCGQPGRQSPLFAKCFFPFFFFTLSLALVVWPRLCDLFVSQYCR